MTAVLVMLARLPYPDIKNAPVIQRKHQPPSSSARIRGSSRCVVYGLLGLVMSLKWSCCVSVVCHGRILWHFCMSESIVGFKNGGIATLPLREQGMAAEKCHRIRGSCPSSPSRPSSCAGTSPVIQRRNQPRHPAQAPASRHPARSVSGVAGSESIPQPMWRG